MTNPTTTNQDNPSQPNEASASPVFHPKGAASLSQESKDPTVLSQLPTTSAMGPPSACNTCLISQLSSAIEPDNKQQQTNNAEQSASHNTTTFDPRINTILSTLLAQGPSSQIDPMTLLNLFSNDLDIHKLKIILATQGTITNSTSTEGLNRIPNDLNPMAYTATTENNPNWLAQKQMLADLD